MIDYNIYPVTERIKTPGINVYHRLDGVTKTSSDSGNIESEICNISHKEYDVTIPYYKETKEYLDNLERIPRGIIIATNQLPVAEKVARYIEDYRVEEDFENCRDQLYDIYGADADMFEFPDSEEEMIQNLYSYNLGFTADSKEIGNVYIPLLQNGGPEVNDAVLYTGLSSSSDIKDKIDAITSVMDGHIYIHILDAMINEPWVSELIMCTGYELIQISEIGIDYYTKVFDKLLSKSGYTLETGFSELSALNMIRTKRGNLFREEDIDSCISHAISRSKKRDQAKNILKRCDFTLTGKKEKSAIDILNEMPGLEEPKKVIREIIALCREEANNSKLKGLHKNMIFAGNPGTAKSTVAELTGRMLAESGISNGKFVIATRADLIGEFVGKTAVKTAKKFDEARGGVLLIDEAAFLMNTDSGGYVKECIKEIVRFMELYPDVCVIMACYDNEVDSLLGLDQGLSSRFSKIVHFKDYSDDIIEEIADYMYNNLGYVWNKSESRELVRKYISRKRLDSNFGNAREMRKIVEGSIAKHALRCMENMTGYDPVITASDIKAAIEDLNGKIVKEKVKMGFCAV